MFEENTSSIAGNLTPVGMHPLGNRCMPQKAWFFFYALCEHMLGLQPEHPDMWNFWLKQMDAHVKTSPLFEEVETEHVPLLIAMKIYGSDSGLRRLRKHVLSVMLMVRRVGLDTDIDGVGWIRQSMIKYIVELLVVEAKQDKATIWNACYIMEFGILHNAVFTMTRLS